MTAAAACLVPSEEVARFDRLWRLRLLKHELSAADPGSWRKPTARSALSGQAAVRDLTDAVSAIDGLGFVVAIGAKSWSELPQPTRRGFGSARTLCFLRLIRIVFDKLEGSADSNRISLRLRLDMDAIGETMTAAERMMAVDSRARERLSCLAFVDPRSDSHFAAVDLVLHSGFQHSARTREQGRSTPEAGSSQPMFPSNFTLELWDGDFIARHLESLEWGGVLAPSGPRRKAGIGAGK